MKDEYGNNRAEAFETLPFTLGLTGRHPYGAEMLQSSPRRSGGPGSDPAGLTPELLERREEETANEWEGERSLPMGRSMGRPMSQTRGKPKSAGARPVVQRPGSRPPLRPPPRPQPPRYPRYPYWGPIYGGGPYGLLVSDPGPYQAPQADDPGQPPDDTAAAFEPVDFPANGIGAGQADDAPEEEIPPKLQAVLTARAPGVTFTDAGTLAAVRKAGKVTGAGLYIITFRKDGRPLAYVGVTGNLQDRIRKHMLCGAVLGVPLRNYRLFVAQPTADVKRLRAIEAAINAAMLLPANRGETTNQRSELEMEVMGPGWV